MAGAIYRIRAVDETPHVKIKARTAGLDGQEDGGELDMGYHDPLLCLFFSRSTQRDWV